MTEPREPRPALRKAPDGRVHPATPTVPSTISLGGGATSDALRGKSKDKLVDLGVRVPKSLRRRVREIAEDQGATADDVVTAILRERLG